MYKVIISSKIVEREYRWTSSPWPSESRKYQVNVFRKDIREWVEKNLHGKVKCVEVQGHWMRMTDKPMFFQGNYHYVSFSRQSDVMLFKLRFSEFLRDDI